MPLLKPQAVSLFSDKITLKAQPKLIAFWNKNNAFTKPQFLGFQIDFEVGSNSIFQDKFIIRRASTILRVQSDNANYFLSAGRSMCIKNGKIESNLRIPLTRDLSILKQNSNICVRGEISRDVSNSCKPVNYLQAVFHFEQPIIGKQNVFSKLKNNSKKTLLESSNICIKKK